jgi:hypothetical protein
LGCCRSGVLRLHFGCREVDQKRLQKIATLKRLRFLYLNEATVDALPQGLYGMKKVELLDISNAELWGFPVQFEKLNHLKVLIESGWIDKRNLAEVHKLLPNTLILY